MPIYIITGGNRGLGLEFTTQLIYKRENTVIATTRSKSSELETLKAYHKNLHVLACDTSSTSSLQAFAKQVGGLIGEDTKIDYLVNNAGINTVGDEGVLGLSSQGLLDHITTNVLGPAKTVELLQSHLQTGSVVMNMSSGLGSVSQALGVSANYCTTYSISKAALNMLTAHQAVELKGKGVAVIVMDPGWVKTDMGGDAAPLEKEHSIGGMLNVLESMKIEDTGKFYEYSGKEKSW